MKKPRKRVKNLTSRQLAKRLEQQIAAARQELDQLEPGRGAKLVNRILELERQLAIATYHIKSKFDAVGHFKVAGSYGSGKRR